MSYIVDGGTNNRPRFASIEEANNFANDVMRRTGIVLGVYESKKPATHTYVQSQN